MAKYLIDTGSNIHIVDDFALREASFNGHLDVVKYLVEVGANIHAVSDQALRYAMLQNHSDVIPYLISKGCVYVLRP